MSRGVLGFARGEGREPEAMFSHKLDVEIARPWLAFPGPGRVGRTDRRAGGSSGTEAKKVQRLDGKDSVASGRSVSVRGGGLPRTRAPARRHRHGFLNGLADEGNDDAPVRRVESDRRLDGQQVVVEAARVDGKELGKESESIASECLEGHWGKGTGRRTKGGKRK
jgi:hypothetical protein